MNATATGGSGRLLGANRDFTLLWVGQAASSLGSAASLVAFPLLVLALTGSPGQVGLVLAAGTAVRLLAGLPGGALADRYDRRRVMLACDLGRVVASAGLAVAVHDHRATTGAVLAVVAADGALGAVFAAAEPAAVRHLVPAARLPLALARNEARGAAATLAGPPLGGLLFAVSPALPFLAGAACSLASLACVALIRTPTRSTVGRAGGTLDGLRWIWRQPLLRVGLLLVSGGNLASNAVVLAVIVESGQRGDPAAATGLVVTLAGAGALAGALVAPRLVGRLALRTLLVTNRVVWTLAAPAALLVDDTYAAGALVAAMYVLGPTGNTALVSHQMAVTPDRLQGRASSARGLCAGLAAPVGTASAGFLLDHLGAAVTAGALAAWTASLATVAASSGALRAAPDGQECAST